MPSEKKRLYIALYPSGIENNEERKYHWAFLIGPEIESEDKVPGTRYHVRNSPLGGWAYQETPLDDVKGTKRMLTRFFIAKIEDEERLVALLRQLPVIRGDSNWRCRTWIASALTEIARDGKCVGTAALDWQNIEVFARLYTAHKIASGRYRSATALSEPKPTWDMLEDKEIVA